MDLPTRARRHAWAAVLPVVLLLVLALRAAGFRIGRTLRFEAGLLPAAGLVLLTLGRRGSRAPEVDLWLGVALLCGALRSGLWASGMPVHQANLAAIGMALACTAGILACRRWRRTRRAA
jgi:hypothetical protein